MIAHGPGPETTDPDSATTRILLVDDDRELCRMIAELLAPQGFAVTAVHDGTQALALVESRPWRLMILDVVLPGMSGLEVLWRLRRRSELPVLMLTARGNDTDCVEAFELGADDYLGKPFNVRELVARLRSLLRRARIAHAQTDRIEVNGISLDRVVRAVAYRGESITLTGAEYRILEALMLQPGHVVSRERLVQQTLGRPLLPWDRSVDTHICNLRRKLAERGGGKLILNVRGTGYLLAG